MREQLLEFNRNVTVNLYPVYEHDPFPQMSFPLGRVVAPETNDSIAIDSGDDEAKHSFEPFVRYLFCNSPKSVSSSEIFLKAKRLYKPHHKDAIYETLISHWFGVYLKRNHIRLSPTNFLRTCHRCSTENKTLISSRSCPINPISSNQLSQDSISQ